jgi:hypothetical protein
LSARVEKNRERFRLSGQGDAVGNVGPSRKKATASASGIRRYVLSALLQLLFAFVQADAFPAAPDLDGLAAGPAGTALQTASLVAGERDPDSASAGKSRPLDQIPGQTLTELPVTGSYFMPPQREVVRASGISSHAYLVRAPPLFPLS